MEDKIKLIDDYIVKLQSVIDSNDCQTAERLQNTVIATFESEIDNILGGLDNYSYGHLDGTPVDFLGDAAVLKDKLINFKTNLQSGIYFAMRRNGGLSVTQHVTQQVQTDIKISFEQTITAIQEMPSDVLSDDEKDILCGKLIAIEKAKDKKTKWEKVQGALKWIADKSIEVGIAALPYIVKALENGGVS